MLDDLKLPYEERAKKAMNPAAKRLFSLMAEKQTNLTLANDETDPKKFLELAGRLGPEIAVLKTHIDILNSFSPSIPKTLSALAETHNFMIFEDRKLADIGSILSQQYSGGIYRIADWANLVNVHAVPGPAIIDAIDGVMKEKKDEIPRGILVLAQMSSEGTLATGEYTRKAVDMANAHKEAVAGYIGNGGDVAQLKQLVGMAFGGHAILTPGVQIQSKGDSMGQRYTLPEEAVSAGSDSIIVGRGIYKSDDPVKMAKTYRQAGWKAYIARTGGRS